MAMIEHNAMNTPSQTRTRLGMTHPVQNGADMQSGNTSIVSGPSFGQIHSRRQPLNNINGNTVSKPSISGYGMSAGAKFGRQEGRGSGGGKFSPQQIYEDAGNYR